MYTKRLEEHFILFLKKRWKLFLGVWKTRGVETAHFYGTERKKKIFS
jgi:hypothetical protein